MVVVVVVVELVVVVLGARDELDTSYLLDSNQDESLSLFFFLDTDSTERIKEREKYIHMRKRDEHDMRCSYLYRHQLAWH